MPYDPNTPLLAACMIVNPSGKILLLERNTDESGRFELPTKKIERDYDTPTDCRQAITEAAWKTARLRVSELTTDPVWCEVRDNDKKLLSTAFCGGVRFPFCIPAQVDYDHHKGYIWASRESIGAGQIDVTKTTETCVSELYSESVLFEDLFPDDRAW
jgi:hypothetical protein